MKACEWGKRWRRNHPVISHQKRVQVSHCCRLQSLVHTECHWQMPVLRDATWCFVWCHHWEFRQDTLEICFSPRKQEDENFGVIFHNVSIMQNVNLNSPAILWQCLGNEEWLSLLEDHTAGMARWLGPPLSWEGRIYLRPLSLACGGPPSSVSVSVSQLFFLIKTLATVDQGPL